jgi:hypothetical protein
LSRRLRLSLAVSLLLVALTVALTLLSACGGGGGGGGGPTAPPPPTRGIVFTPGSAVTSGISLSAAAPPDNSTLVLEVRADSVTDLYGVAFNLRYPNTVLRYVRATQGPFLTGASLQVAEGTGGALIVGLSKLGTMAGSSGSGVLLTLEFQSVAAGDGTFSFANNTAINSTAQTLSSLSWSAGTARVTL